MSWRDWVAEKQLSTHKTTKEEIGNLLKIVERDSKDAQVEGLSADVRFVIAYNAALKLCTILLYASGYRAKGAGAHLSTIGAMPFILGERFQRDADYLESCRTRRNHAEYDFVDVVEDKDVEELIQFVDQLKEQVTNWMQKHHSDLMP